MSNCMTIADETVDQKETCTDRTPKDVVDFILEEALLSAFVVSDKGCSRIGDFNITDDFRQQDQLPHPKDFEQADQVDTQESNLNARESVDRSARENLELLIGSYVKKEEKATPACGECTVITEEILANNELQIQNGQIHLERSKREKAEADRRSYFAREDVVKDEKIEIEYFNEGRLNKIYVPLREAGAGPREKPPGEEDPGRPFEPYTTEELRQSTLQVWGKESSSLVGKWDGDALAQREEAVRLMEELSSVHVFPDCPADPNRPRACSFAEEDVKKMIREIEEISFTQCHANTEDADVAYHPDGQGDADLESKSFTKSKDNIAKPQMHQQPEEEFSPQPEPCDETNEMISTDAEGVHPSQRETFGDNPSSSSLLIPFLLSFPETMSLSGNTGSLSSSKLDEFTLKNMEYPSELDVQAFQGRLDVTRESRSIDNALENASGLSNQGTISLGRLTAASSETCKRLDPDSFSKEKDLMETGVFVKKSEEMRKSHDAGNFLQGSVEIAKNEEDSRLIREGISGEEASKFVEIDAGNFESKLAESDLMKIQEKHPAVEEENPTLDKNLLDCLDSNKSLSKGESSSNSEALQSSQTPSQELISSEALEEDGSPVSCNVASQKFKLQSQKMYLGANHEVAGQSPNEFVLTESEEAFIDATESVIQIIDPAENSVDEDSSKISFLLLSEVPNLKPLSRNVVCTSEISLEKTDSSDMENLTRRIYSGMTTIGPIKDAGHDPKDLTAPDVDFGKMTRITSSRQLANDIGLFNPDMSTIKILEEDDSDENGSLNIETSHLERTSLVNRDIASLTKVQKIREVMSYQPKSEEDFEDEEVLARPRLDLKDVESMTDERYKVPEVSIPLLSFEIGESDLTTEKELMESMSLVISGLTNPTYFDEEMEEDNVGNQRNTGEPGTEHISGGELVQSSESSNAAARGTEGDIAVKSWGSESRSKLDAGKELEKDMGETPRVSNGSQSESSQKYGTLGSVFKKASSRLLRKEEDTFVRNSKSLPRDSSRTSTTDSIRSMLDDCQSSASNILKKSRSLLKNTQSVFRSISQGRVTQDSGPGRSADQKKPFSPSESDVTAMEKKFSGFLKKEDFTKAKNLIKGKVEKALKGVDGGSSEAETSRRDLRVAVINKENLQVDRMENFKKLLPKTPLVYKSQFVKSQMNVQSNPSEPMAATTNVAEGEEDRRNSQVGFNDSIFEDNIDKNPKEETEPQEQADSDKQFPFQEKLQWVSSRENIESVTNEDAELKQPDFIIMETVQGLPAGSDLESPSSEKENLNVDNIGKIEAEKEGQDLKKAAGASHSLEVVSEGGRDVAPCFPEVDDEKAVTKSPSERKIKPKKKKLTARLRSFWCSAFGKVKTPPANAADLP